MRKKSRGCGSITVSNIVVRTGCPTSFYTFLDYSGVFLCILYLAYVLYYLHIIDCCTHCSEENILDNDASIKTYSKSIPQRHNSRARDDMGVHRDIPEEILSAKSLVEGIMLYTLKLRSILGRGCIPCALLVCMAKILTILVHCSDRYLTAHAQDSMVSPSC